MLGDDLRLVGLLHLELLVLALGDVGVRAQLLETYRLVGFDQVCGDLVPYLGLGFDGVDDHLLGGLDAGIDLKDSHKMAKTGLFLQPIKQLPLLILRQHPTGCQLDDINLTKEMFFIQFIDLPLTDEDMQETLLNQHMQNIILFMLEQQSNQATKKPGLLNGLKNLLAGDGDTVTENFQKLVLVEGDEGGFGDFLEGGGEVVAQADYHGLRL